MKAHWTAPNWLNCFIGGNISPKIKPRIGRPSVVDEGPSQYMIEKDTITYTRIPFEGLGQSKDTIKTSGNYQEVFHTDSDDEIKLILSIYLSIYLLYNPLCVNL